MMKNQPTYDDANLILRLYELRRDDKLREARKWLGGSPAITSREQFLKMCPPGSEENAYYRMVTTYWDMASSFVVNGILNRELFYRSSHGELMFVWEKVKLLVPEVRAMQKNPLIMHNMEEVAQGFKAFYDENAPGYYDGFAANIAKSGK